MQQIVIDPEGEFASLREKFDYVLATKGKSGETSADPRAAAMLAERLLQLKVNAIIDLYEYHKDERRRFVRLFLEAMVEAKKQLWHPVLVVIDEAHSFAPQDGDSESLAAVLDLVGRGRKRGFCPVFATQRLSKLHKDAADLRNKLIGVTGLDVDMKRAADDLGFGKEAMLALRDLEPGQFWAYGPALMRAPTKIKIGPVQTTHPKVGAKFTASVPPPTDRIRALLPQLADLPAEAEERARTEADLRKELATARREITVLRTSQPTRDVEKVVTKTVEVPVLLDEPMRALTKVIERLSAEGGHQVVVGQQIQAAAQSIVATLALVVEGKRRLAARPPATTTGIRLGVAGKAARVLGLPPQPQKDEGFGDLTGPEQRILDAIAWLDSIGVPEPEQPAVAFLAGYTFNGGAFNNPRGRLRTRGLVSYRGDGIALTDEGRKLARVPEAQLDAESLQRFVLDRLPGPEQRLLVPLLRAYPESMGNEELAAAAKYAPRSGAFNNPKGRLRSLGLIEYPEPGRCAALPLLFLE